MDYCKQELSEMPELRDYAKVWVCAQLGKDDKPVRVIGIQALQQCVDLPISRYSDSKAAKLLSERVESYVADQGMRGAAVFVYLSSSEKSEQKCRSWESWLKVWKARPADRWEVRVR